MNDRQFELSRAMYFSRKLDDTMQAHVPERPRADAGVAQTDTRTLMQAGNLPDSVHPRTEVLEKAKELKKAEKKLKRQKLVFKSEADRQDQKRTALQAEEQQLHEAIVRQNTNIQENEDKRVKALRKVDTESMFVHDKRVELKLLQDEEKRVTERLRQEEAKMKKLMQYAVYLDKVVDESEAYTEISDIMDRYRTLNTTYRDLLTLDSENQDGIDAKRKEFAKLKDARGNEVLGLTNEIANLQSRMDDMQQVNTKLESEWAHIQNTAAKQTLLLGQLKLATNNLYVMVNSHLGAHKYSSVATFPQMLERIELFIQDLTDITSQFHSPGLAAEGSASTLGMAERDARRAQPFKHQIVAKYKPES